MSWLKGFEVDRVPRYVPERILVMKRTEIRGVFGVVPVTAVRFHLAGSFGKDVPIRSDANCVELVTEYGSRWFGCERAYINSELRMVLVGFPAKDEEMSHWLPVPKNLCDEHRSHGESGRSAQNREG